MVTRTRLNVTLIRILFVLLSLILRKYLFRNAHVFVCKSVYFLLSHVNNGYANAPQCYFYTTLPVLLSLILRKYLFQKRKYFCL
jgi:hypothetical protein